MQSVACQHVRDVADVTTRFAESQNEIDVAAIEILVVTIGAYGLVGALRRKSVGWMT